MTDVLVEGLNARVYEIITKEGAFRVTIPASYRVTFGPIVNVAGKPSYEGGMALRVWETKDLQRGLWTNVISFRDLSLTMQVAAVRKFGSEDWYMDHGTDEVGTVERAWKSADEIKERPTVTESSMGAEDADLPWNKTPILRSSRSYVGGKP